MKRDETTLTVERPRTKAGRALFADWLERRRDHPPNTKRALDLILAIEKEAAAPTENEAPS